VNKITNKSKQILSLSIFICFGLSSASKLEATVLNAAHFEAIINEVKALHKPKFCEKGLGILKTTIRAGSGKYCNPNIQNKTTGFGWGPLLAKIGCWEHRDGPDKDYPQGKPFSETECGQKIVKQTEDQLRKNVAKALEKDPKTLEDVCKFIAQFVDLNACKTGKTDKQPPQVEPQPAKPAPVPAPKKPECLLNKFYFGEPLDILKEILKSIKSEEYLNAGEQGFYYRFSLSKNNIDAVTRIESILQQIQGSDDGKITGVDFGGRGTLKGNPDRCEHSLKIAYGDEHSSRKMLFQIEIKIE
jgi:hypothetical protein